MALVNANYEFVFVDVGKNGRISDGGVFQKTTFYQNLSENSLKLSDNSETEEHLNFISLVDNGFGAHKHILKPFLYTDLTHKKRIYSYRLSRGRNAVENAFGLTSSRFRVLHTGVNIAPEKVNYVVLATCILHNFLRKRSSTYVSSTTFDTEDSTHEIIQDRDWRKTYVELVDVEPLCERNTSKDSKQNRESYVQYFIGNGKVDWQEEMLKRGKA
jgi:hypothetical protein